MQLAFVDPVTNYRSMQLAFVDPVLSCLAFARLVWTSHSFFMRLFLLTMLPERLVGSEEVIPIPDVNQSFESTEAKDIRDSVKASVLEIEVRDYNPIRHERGFHQKLNVLVKESLHFGSLPAKSEELPPEPTSTQGDSLNESKSSKQAMGMVGSEEEILHMDFKTGRDKITEHITEEWEKLIVNEIPKISSPTCISKPKLDHLAFTPLESSKPLDEKTSRILERLKTPRKLKSKLASPVITSSSAPVDSCIYTWQIYSERLILAEVYGFWKHVSKLDRLEIRHYLEMFYALKHRKLAESVPLAVDEEK
nr:hypothetical protein [Tanacetum cinerariifolium]